MPSPHQWVVAMGLVLHVRGGLSSHICHNAPPIPGGSSGQYGALPLRATGRGGRGTRVPCWLGRSGPDGAASRVHAGVFLVSARGGLGPRGFAIRCTRALRRTLRTSCTRASCAAGASVSVRMAGCRCPLIDSARIWWIAKTGHRFVAAGVAAVRSRRGMASSCCQPSRLNLHVAVQSLGCDQRR